MNRRGFLKSLVTVAAVATTPKFIFDMGANKAHYNKDYNLYLLDTRELYVTHNPVLESFEYEWVTMELIVEDGKIVAAKAAQQPRFGAVGGINRAPDSGPYQVDLPALDLSTD